MPQIYSAKDEASLMREIWDPQIADNPEAFAMLVYPWGKANTPLEHFTGPRGWQREVFQEMALAIKENRSAPARKQNYRVFQEAVASGRGIGKSATLSILTHWFVSTRIGASCIVTANTEQQLLTRTWPELGRWITMSINGHWFDKTATRLVPDKWFAEALKRDLKLDTAYYYAHAQLWSEENPDAFAGAHNPHGMMVLFDEASGIAEPIWKVTEGFFTEPIVDRYWLAFSNPRRTTGAFFECFHKMRDFWRTRQIDSRNVEDTDKGVYDRIIAKYGAESNEAFVEVYGQFPRTGDRQFIARSIAEEAVAREVAEDKGSALVMGVDVSRFGDDKSVICFRQGRDARSIPWQRYRNLSTVELTNRVAEAADKYKPDAIFVDGNGVGGGVVDLLASLGYRVIEVQFGGGADEKDQYMNKRVECWGRMREWLLGGALPQNRELVEDLCNIEYGYTPAKNQIKLESKDEMKRRGLASPDEADALSLTFAQPVARRDMKFSRSGGRPRIARDVDYSMI